MSVERETIGKKISGKAVKVGITAVLTFVLMVGGIGFALIGNFGFSLNFSKEARIYDPTDFIYIYTYGVNGQAEIALSIDSYEIKRKIGNTSVSFSEGAKFMRYLETLEYTYDGVELSINRDYGGIPRIFGIENAETIDIDINVVASTVNADRFILAKNQITVMADGLEELITDVTEITPTMVRYHLKMLLEDEGRSTSNADIVDNGSLLGAFYRIDDTTIKNNPDVYEIGGVTMVYVFAYNGEVTIIGETELFKPRAETNWIGRYLSAYRLDLNSNELKSEVIVEAMIARGFTQYEIELEL